MSDMALAMTQMMFDTLRIQMDALTEDVVKLQKRDAIGTAYGFPQVTLAEAPLDMDDFEYRTITDGRKPGEGAGTGTGVMAMYNPATNQWLRTDDYSAVVV
jgi:hypothetical protein